MEYVETYKGHSIKIVTARAANGTWHSTAELLDGGGAHCTPEASDSEEEAHRAALSAAMADVDRRRARTGKP